MSLRGLAATHGINNHSAVATVARKREWARKREEYRTGVAERTMVYMADQEGARIAQEAKVRDNAIEAIDEAISRLRADMRLTQKVLENDEWVERPLFLIKPQEMALLIDRLQVLFGRPSNITEERNLGINLSSGGIDPELLRGIVEATRGVTNSGTAARAPFPRIDRAGQN